MCLAIEAFFASEQVPVFRKEDILNKLLRNTYLLIDNKCACSFLTNLVKMLDYKLKCLVMDSILTCKYAVNCSEHGQALSNEVNMSLYEDNPEEWAKQFPGMN